MEKDLCGQRRHQRFKAIKRGVRHTGVVLLIIAAMMQTVAAYASSIYFSHSSSTLHFVHDPEWIEEVEALISPRYVIISYGDKLYVVEDGETVRIGTDAPEAVDKISTEAVDNEKQEEKDGQRRHEIIH